MFTLSSTAIIVVCCLIAESYFSSSEIGLLSAKRPNLLLKADEGNLAAQRVLKLLESPERLFGTTLLGTNLSTVLAATVMSSYFIEHFGTNGDFYAALVFSPMTMLFGEIIPKSIAQVKADTYALSTSRPLTIISRFLTPGIIVFGSISHLINRLIGKSAAVITREDLRSMLNYYIKDMQPKDRHMISRIFDFGGKRIHEVMKQLIEVVAVAEKSDIHEAINIVSRRGFSRLPVYRDRIDNIIGVVSAFDLFDADPHEKSLLPLIRPVFYIPQSATIDATIKLLDSQKTTLPLAVVVNEYGGAVGIISVEDLLEEIVGEIEDEFDQEKEILHEVRKNVYDVSGRIKIEDLAEELSLKLPEGDYETLGGLLLDHFGQIPKAGDSADFDGAHFTVLRATEKAIKLVRLELIK